MRRARLWIVSIQFILFLQFDYALVAEVDVPIFAGFTSIHRLILLDVSWNFYQSCKLPAL